MVWLSNGYKLVIHIVITEQNKDLSKSKPILSDCIYDTDARTNSDNDELEWETIEKKGLRNKPKKKNDYRSKWFLQNGFRLLWATQI